MNPGGKRGGKSTAPAGSIVRTKGDRMTATSRSMSGTMSTVPYKGMTDSDKQGVKEALAIRYGRPDPAVDAVRRRMDAAVATGRKALGVENKTAKDSDFKSVASLKGTKGIFGGGTFVPDKLMTVARRRKLGIGSFASRVENANMFAERMAGGWVINKRSGR